MILRNIIELIIVVITGVVLIPLFIKKRKAAKDLDGFELLENNAGSEDPDDVIVIEQEK